jgi:hypothetical protein
MSDSGSAGFQTCAPRFLGTHRRDGRGLESQHHVTWALGFAEQIEACEVERAASRCR